jgi:hypothetical protein
LINDHLPYISQDVYSLASAVIEKLDGLENSHGQRFKMLELYGSGLNLYSVNKATPILG